MRAGANWGVACYWLLVLAETGLPIFGWGLAAAMEWWIGRDFLPRRKIPVTENGHFLMARGELMVDSGGIYGLDSRTTRPSRDIKSDHT